VIFDTDILIDYLLGREQAREFLLSFEKGERFLTSISAMEIYRGARNKREFDIFKKFFESNFEDLLHINEEASKLSLKLIETYTLSHGLTLPDALIAAIAISKDTSLFTGNLKHFSFIQGLKVYLPAYRK
jgi:predicted nucleic acid-binding protein